MHDELLIQRLGEINTSLQDLRTEISNNNSAAESKYATKEYLGTVVVDVAELKKRTSWIYTKVISMGVIIPFLITSTLKKSDIPPFTKETVDKVLKLQSDPAE